MSLEFLINGLMSAMAVASLFLATVSFMPKFPGMLVPTWSSQFFSTIIVVIASKLITVYVVLVWFVTGMVGTQNTYFIWSYFLCMLLGIFVYFHFGTSERNRRQTIRILESTILAIMISAGILFYYAFTAIVAYSYWLHQKSELVLVYITVISLVDFFFFGLLWLRYWLRRGQITKEARVPLQDHSPTSSRHPE